jgi:hypothetical protein
MQRIIDAAARIVVRGTALRPAYLFGLIYLLASVVNLAIGFAVTFRPTPAALDADELEYYTMAGDIINGSFQLHPRRSIAFPLLLAAIRCIYDSIYVVQIIVTLLSSLAPPLLFLVARKLSGSAVIGALSGLALALWPATLFFGTSLYSETVALPVFLLFLLILPVGSRITDREAVIGFAPAIAAGILLALATHVRTMYLLFIPFVIAIVFLEERRMRIAAYRTGLVLAAYAGAILPWSIYMTTRFSQPIIVTANGGETIAGALNPRLLQPERRQDTTLPGRSSWNGPGKWIPYTDTGYLTEEELKLPYAELDSRLRTRTLEWILRNPGDAATLQLYKLGYMWGFYSFKRNEFRQLILGNFPIIVILMSSAVAFIRSHRARAELVRLWIVPVFVTGVALISWGSWRFRQPADAALLAFCIIAICWAFPLTQRMTKKAYGSQPKS